jgi:hypothetical protein
MDVSHLVAKLAFNLSTTVFDAEYGDARWFPFLALSAALVVAAFVAAVRHRGQNSVGLALAVLTIVPIVALDIIGGTHRSASTRYLMPAYVGTLLVVAWFLAWLPRRRAIAASMVLFSGALLSSLAGTTATVWWDSYASATTPSIASVLRVSRGITLLSEGPCASLLTLALAGPLDTPVRCLADVADVGSTALIIAPSPRFRSAAARAGYRMQEVVEARAPSGLVGTFRGAGAADDLDTLWLMRR